MSTSKYLAKTISTCQVSELHGVQSIYLDVRLKLNTIDPSKGLQHHQLHRKMVKIRVGGFEIPHVLTRSRCG